MHARNRRASLSVYMQPLPPALMHMSRRAWPRHQLQAEEGEGEGEGVTREGVAEVRKGQKEQESLFTPQEWWRVFLQTCLGLLHLGHRPRALHLIHCAQATRKFSTEQLETVSPFQQLSACCVCVLCAV